MAACGARQFIEVGPGRVLSGLCRRILPGVDVARTNDRDRLAAVLAH
jgi:[acyl-carrier-protein] S-malonyltransferase